MPLFPLLKHNNLYEVMEDMFDKWVTYDPNDDTMAYPDLMLKAFPFKLNHKLLNGCCQVEWYEEQIDEILATTLTTALVASTTIPFASVENWNQLRGPSVGSQVYIVDQTTGVTHIRTITAVSGTDVTLNSAVSAPIGSVVSRGPKYAVIGDCVTGLDDFFTKTQVHPRVSNFARIVYSIRFNRCDLNKDRLNYNYGYTVNDWIKNELVQPAQGFRNLFVKALMFGNNTFGPHNYGTVTTGSESMGFITDIWKAQKCVNPTNDPAGKIFVHDFTDCCTTLDTDCEILEIFQDRVIEPILASGAYVDGEPMTVWMNQAQIKEMRKFGPAISDVFGQQGIIVRNLDTTDDGLFYNKFTLQSFQIGQTKFEYKYSRILNELFPTRPVMIIFPAKYVAFYQYVVDGLDSNEMGGKITARINNDRSPRLEFVDASQLIHWNTGARDCYYYRMNLTYALLLANLCSGAYAFVTNLRTKGTCSALTCGDTFDLVDTVNPTNCDITPTSPATPREKACCNNC
jgi:hypothetical protein